ncbi:hypothetical protein VSU19_08350, partial [Verrucomicrobiales bacterium BCK34]|nr:hypothetical protein [Verrucomicrobiales bacterium BCK34]
EDGDVLLVTVSVLDYVRVRGGIVHVMAGSVSLFLAVLEPEGVRRVYDELASKLSGRFPPFGIGVVKAPGVWKAAALKEGRDHV